MPQTFGQNWQDVQDAALPVISKPARTSDEVIFASLDQGLDGPMRMYGALVPDAKLYFSASRPLASNGSGKMLPAIDDKMPIVAASTLNLTSAATTGGTFQTEGATFAIPTGIVGQFRRMAVALRSSGEINTKFSAAAASLGGLDTIDNIANGLDGQLLGFVDLEYHTTTGFKTAGSVTAVIENSVSSAARIVNVSGGGSGGGAKMPMRIQTTAGNLGTISGGSGRFLDTNEEMANYDGTGTTTGDFAKPQTINLDTILGSSPANNTTYYLYWDRDAFAAPITLTDADGFRAIIPITQSSYKLLTTAPTAVNRARYVYRGTLHSATTGNMWSGAGASFSSAEIPVASVAPVSVSPVVYHASQVVGTVGTVGQKSAGHYFSTKSYRAGTAAFWRFSNALNVADQAPGAARPLTNNGSVLFTAGTDILGATGMARLTGSTGVYLSSTDALFDQGAANNWSMTVWVSLDNWNAGQFIMSQGNATSGSAESWGVQVSANLGIRMGTQTANSDYYQPVNNFAAGSLHQITIRYVAADLSLYLEVDGSRAASLTNAASGLAATGATRKMCLGGLVNSGGVVSTPMTGYISDAIFINDSANALIDPDFRKLYASRLDHSKDVTALNQHWTAVTSDGLVQQAAGWVVDQGDKDTLFLDMSGLAPTTIVDLVMRDIGISATVVPAGKPFDATYSANPTFPIAHGLGDVPVLLGMQEVSAGVWQPISLQGVLKVDGTNISEAATGDFNTQLGPLSGSARVRLIAYVGTMPAAVAEANASRGGVLTNSAQAIAGDKTFIGAVKTATVAKSADYTILDGDGYTTIFVTTGSSTRTITLPAAANNVGRSITIKKVDNGTGKVTLARTGADTIDGSTGFSIGVGAVNQYHYITLVSDGTIWNVTGEQHNSQWLSFTPSGSWNTNTSYTGFMRREQDSLRVQIKMALSNAPNATTLTMNIPAGLTVDTTKVVSQGSAPSPLGNMTILFSGTNTFTGMVIFNSSSLVTPVFIDDAVTGTAFGSINATSPHTWAANDTLSMEFLIPITEFAGR